MAARVLDGAAVAQQIRTEVGPAVVAFTERAGRPPGLGIVLVGDDPASEIYVRSKLKSAADAGSSPTSTRSEEHTSELQSHVNLVCRLLLEKKKKKTHCSREHQSVIGQA